MISDVHDTLFLGNDEEVLAYDTNGIPNGKLYFRYSHFLDPTAGALLTDGEVSVRQVSLVQADPLGLGGKVDVGDMIIAGQTSLKPRK